MIIINWIWTPAPLVLLFCLPATSGEKYQEVRPSSSVNIHNCVQISSLKSNLLLDITKNKELNLSSLSPLWSRKVWWLLKPEKAPAPSLRLHFLRSNIFAVSWSSGFVWRIKGQWPHLVINLNFGPQSFQFTIFITTQTRDAKITAVLPPTIWPYNQIHPTTQRTTTVRPSFERQIRFYLCFLFLVSCLNM